MSNAVRELLDGASAMLVDFDGPLASLMPPPENARAADAARAVLGGIPLPDDLASTTDHIEVLRWSLEHLPRTLMLKVEAACARLETDAAATCDEGVNCFALLNHARHSTMPVAVVSNNASLAVEAFLQRSGWLQHVDAICARTPSTVDKLKPHPDLLLAAADALGVDVGSAIFFGDSVSDVIAAKRAGCKVVGLYKSPERMLELDAAGADLVKNLQNAVC
jgi:beta-phosphoglucomutase-like phosphatase (HAD superfamily)